MKRPLFSCVIPVKGERPFFDEAIASLKSQGMGDDLEIIVQDCGNDGVMDCVSEGVRYFCEPDSGQSDALNKGFAKAKGEWLFWLNADDVLLPGALEKVRDCITQRGAGVEWIAGGTQYLDADGKYIGAKFDNKWHSWLYRHMPVWTYGPSAFFKRSLWGKHGIFDVSMQYLMDIELWTRWARKGKHFEVVQDFIWGFRVHSGSKTTGGKFDAERAVERRAFYEKYGLRNLKFWLMLQRLSRLMDGSYFKK